MKNVLVFAFLAVSLALGAAERMIYVTRHCQAVGKGPDVIRPVAGDAGITPLGVSVLKESRPGRTYSEPSHTDSETAPTVSELESSEPNSTGTTDSAARNSRV